jgi:CheY-like chemotaxis protein
VCSSDLALKLETVRCAKVSRIEKRAASVFMPKGKVLVADDVATNLDVARGLMSRYGLTVRCVPSGTDAIDILKEGKEQYDIIFMDHMMPDMDGMEAVRIIRGGGGGEYAKTTPIVMLTANAALGRRDMFLQGGADDLLAKPIDIDSLDSALRTWVPKEKQQEKYGGEPNPPGAAADGDASFAIPGINSVSGLRNTAGDAALYEEILLTFCMDADGKSEKIAKAAEDGDIKLYTTLVHGLKGAARSIGADSLANLAERLEKAGAENDAPSITGKTGELISETRKLADGVLSALNAR